MPKALTFENFCQAICVNYNIVPGPATSELRRRLVEATEAGDVAAAWQQKKQEAPPPEAQDSIYGNRLPYQAFFHYIDNAKLIETLFASGTRL